MTGKNCVALLALAIATTMVSTMGRAHEGDDHGIAAAAQSSVSAPATTFGESIPGGAATPLATALAEVASPDKRVIAGRIGKVCQNKGCWMTLVDGDAVVRVETGYRFAIPAEAQGEAQVFGTLKRADLSADRAAHLRAESLDVEAGEGWVIDATGVRIFP